uniref:inositol monophosphatase family protein n=1 Tax=Pararhizobium sp. IMCC3301 TaxID=3067904 RepID=UPI0027405EA9|nr:inositol monophosphatase family protein [Pararhizobium sp. IMCC3301]
MTADSLNIAGTHEIKRKQQFAEDLAAEAAELAVTYFQQSETLRIESKNPRDFVSEADRNVEDMIRQRIRAQYPEDDIVGEEGGGVESGAYWCVDPIDGTSNFLAGIPFWGVSIGYCENRLPVMGAICIPLLDILVSANSATPGIRYNRSEKSEFQRSEIPSVVLGQSPYWGTSSFRQAQDIFLNADLECMNLRCSVVGTAFAALGMTQGYYEEQTNMWDVAAGYVVAAQAGLHASIRRNDLNNKLTISVLSPNVFEQIGAQLAERNLEPAAMQ